MLPGCCAWCNEGHGCALIRAWGCQALAPFSDSVQFVHARKEKKTQNTEKNGDSYL